MRIVRTLGGCLVAFIGVVWTLQGLGSEFVPRSFMTNSMWWVFIGLVTIAIGLTIAIRSWRRVR